MTQRFPVVTPLLKINHWIRTWRGQQQRPTHTWKRSKEELIEQKTQQRSHPKYEENEYICSYSTNTNLEPINYLLYCFICRLHLTNLGNFLGPSYFHYYQLLLDNFQELILTYALIFLSTFCIDLLILCPAHSTFFLSSASPSTESNL